MNRFLLYTNIISNITKAVPPKRLLARMGEQAEETLFVATLTLAEIWRSVLDMPSGRKRERLEAWFVGPEGPPGLFAGRVLAFDEQSALIWARFMADGWAIGRSRSALDTIIAATAMANHCVVVTDNERDFVGVETFHPLC